MTFSVSTGGAFGKQDEVELVEGGDLLSVTRRNLPDFVRLYADQVVMRGVRLPITTIRANFLALAMWHH